MKKRSAQINIKFYANSMQIQWQMACQGKN